MHPQCLLRDKIGVSVLDGEVVDDLGGIFDFSGRELEARPSARDDRGAKSNLGGGHKAPAVDVERMIVRRLDARAIGEGEEDILIPQG